MIANLPLFKSIAHGAEVLGGKLESLAAWMEHNPWLAEFAMDAVILGGAVAGVLATVGAGALAMAGWAATGLTVAKSLSLLYGFLGPVGWGIAGVSTLVYILWRHWDDIAQAFQIGGHIVGLLGEALMEQLGYGLGWVDDQLSAFSQSFLDVFNMVTNMDLSEAGRALLGSLANGIESAIGLPEGAISDALETLRGYLPFSDAKVGPLSDLTASGASIPATLAEGVRANTGRLEAAMEGLPAPGIGAGAGSRGRAGGGAFGGGGTVVTVQFSPTIHLGGVASGQEESVRGAVIEALREGSQELLWEMERVMNEIQRRRAFA